MSALDELHGEEPMILIRAELVQLHEVWMGDIGERSEFALEPVQRLGCDVLQTLQRYRDAFHAIVHLVDHAEAARSEQALDAEAIGPSKGRGNNRGALRAGD